MAEAVHNTDAITALPRLPHLLVVAGATGAGKSTFIHRLVYGRLQPEIGALLPAGVDNWIVLSKRLPEQAPAIAAWETLAARPSVMLEYTLNNRKGQKPYRSDAHLRLIRVAEAVTVVTLRPSPQRLASQFAYYAGSGPWWRRALMSKKRLDEQAKRAEPLLRLYATPGWLDDLHASWASYLATVACEGTIVTEIVLQPDPNGRVGRDRRWQLCAAPSGVAPGPAVDGCR